MEENFPEKEMHSPGILKLSPDALAFKERRDKLIADDFERFYLFNQKARELEERHPDARRYVLFHLLIHSTPPSTCDKYDLPGKDSIEKFLAGL